jgi:broad specificity phosphatase PhoE
MKEKYSIIFVRHGHRDKPVPDADNGLSPKGRKQVEELVTKYEEGKLPKAKLFWTSPKIRCQETVRSLSEVALSHLVVEKLLDEQGPNESRGEFSQRIAKLLKKVSEVKQNIYLCSHGDVIPEAIDALTGHQVDLSKGQVAIITNDDGWTLT